MKQKLLLSTTLLIFLTTAAWAQDQYEIQFTYDAAGNQTLRDRVCINCGSSKQEVQDSTSVVELDLEEDILQDAFGDKDIEDGTVVAYPNPVSSNLSVEWIKTEKRVSHIILYSGVGQQLFRRDISSNQGNLDLYMGNYPIGRYILYVQYADNTKKTFHIIKK
nr:T9SS type A sorting domain-containing protein [uncultured Allomuricauda sp.]